MVDKLKKHFERFKNNPLFWAIVGLVVIGLVWLLVSPIGHQANSPSQPPVNGQPEPGPGVVDPKDEPELVFGEKIDDWVEGVYNSTSPNEGQQPVVSSAVSPLADGSNLGFAVGGAGDINNFRQNIENGYMPIPTDISHEGIFYDYFFDTGQQQPCQELFCPSYATAISPDPISRDQEYFLAVGLNSNIKEDSFDRKNLNLVVALDVSSSMKSPFDRYYYDQLNRLPTTTEADQEAANASKIEIANEALVGLLEQLRPADRLGIVLFNHGATTAKPLRLVGETDLAKTAAHIKKIVADGGTNMDAGYQMATDMLSEIASNPDNQYENRIIVLTDAQINLGATDRKDVKGLIQDAADSGIYTTLLGVGVDFNTDLTTSLSRVRGANHFTVHSGSDFKKQLAENFKYMVTPLVFDLDLKLEGSGYEIRAVYGSPDADIASGAVMKVGTLFPSPTESGQTRGGLVLLHLRKVSGNPDLRLTVRYHDRDNNQASNQQKVSFIKDGQTGYDNNGIRKGIALARLVNGIQSWLATTQKPDQFPLVSYDQIGIPIVIVGEPSEWERRSQQLTVSEPHRRILTGLRNYIKSEAKTLDDLNREVKMLDQILDSDQNRD